MIPGHFSNLSDGVYLNVAGMNASFSPHHEPCLLQGVWDFVRAGQEEVLLSPYLPACCAFLTHVLLCVPFFLLDLLSCVSSRVRSWRIEDVPSARQWLECLGRLAHRYVTVVLPATALLQCVLRSPVLPEQAPSVYGLCVEVLACFLLFDTLFFIWHFSMHRFPWLYRSVHQQHHRNQVPVAPRTLAAGSYCHSWFPWLYRSVHQQHHRNQVPLALAAQDASGWELLSLLVLALLSAWVVGCHPLSEALFHLLNSWLAVEDHCGYNLPWGLHRLLPSFGIGGAPFHQLHHAKHSGNYAPYFTHWDLLFGTYRY